MTPHSVRSFSRSSRATRSWRRAGSTAGGAVGGYTLVELSIVLVIAALIGMTLWQLVPRILRLPAVARLTAAPIDQAEQALQGFVMAHGRLPCPATAVGGTESCAPAAATGWLPAATLGVHTRVAVRYGVYRGGAASAALDADLALARDRYAQMLPAGAALTNINGLDFCVALGNVLRAPGTFLTAGAASIPIAYGLATTGGNGAFAGLNAAPGRFEMTGTPKSVGYDNDTRTVGAAELFGKIGCAGRLSAANGAARAAFAAHDADRLATMIVEFRTFAITVRELNVTLASVGLALATADLVDAVATTATAIALAVETAGGLAAAVAGGALAIAAATASEAAAIASTVTSAQALNKARSQRDAAVTYRALTAAESNVALMRAQAQDAKGILP